VITPVNNSCGDCYIPPMLPVKMFGVACAAFAALAILVRVVGPIPWLGNPNVGVHFTSVFLGRWQVVVLGAVVCGIFAGLYSFFALSLHYPMNGRLSVANFVLIVVAFVLLICFQYSPLAEFKAGDDQRTVKLMLLFIVVPVICLFSGCVLFAVNCGWTVIRWLRHT